MSVPANRKNVPAAHTPVTTGFRCEFCHGLFAKQYLLKIHQHKLHGLPRTVEEPLPVVTPLPLPPLPLPSITTLVLPAIDTAAMAVVKARGEIPFAVLHIANEIPLIVRVLEQGPVSVLKAAENSDFRESQRGSPVGTSVPIAVVASIYQKFTEDGKVYYVIRGPGSRNLPTMTERVADPPANAEPEVPEGVLQESLDGGDIYKTLTQINVEHIELLPPNGKSGRISDIAKNNLIICYSFPAGHRDQVFQFFQPQAEEPQPERTQSRSEETRNEHAQKAESDHAGRRSQVATESERAPEPGQLPEHRNRTAAFAGPTTC